MKTTTPSKPPLEQRQFVKVDDLRPDLEQPRQVFDQAKLESLAASIKEQGIIHDLIVEYRPAVRIDAPDLVTKDWRAIEEGSKRVLLTGNERMVKDFAHGKDKAWYQIVDGERRWKAALLAGVKEVPVAVRVIDDKARLALQVVANQQHEALNALEEAAAYRKEIDSGKHTAESLYKTLGISRGTLFARLALNRLHPPVRVALEQGKISVSVAGLVTMVPGLKAQEALIGKITKEDDWQYPWSFRDVQEHIEEEYCRQLKGAPFDPKRTYEGEFKENKDEGSAGELARIVTLHLRGACTQCRYRSGNLGIECGNANVCTRPNCFEAKTAAAWLERSAKAQQAGQKVIDAKEFARVKGQYVGLDQSEYIGNDYRTWEKAMGRHSKQVDRVLVQTADGEVKEMVARKDAKEAAKKNGVKVHEASSNRGYDYEAEKAKRKAKSVLTEQAVEQALPLVQAKLKTVPTLAAWRLVARWVLKDQGFHSRKDKIEPEKFKEAEALQWVLQALYCPDGDAGVRYDGDLDDDFALICEQVGVDVQGMLKTVKTEAAAAEKTKAAKGGGKPRSKGRR